MFKDKPGGLVVDYLGLADELKAALATYTESGGTGKTAIDQAEAVAVMLEAGYGLPGLRGRFGGGDIFSIFLQDRCDVTGPTRSPSPPPPCLSLHLRGRDR